MKVFRIEADNGFGPYQARFWPKGKRRRKILNKMVNAHQNLELHPTPIRDASLTNFGEFCKFTAKEAYYYHGFKSIEDLNL